MFEVDSLSSITTFRTMQPIDSPGPAANFGHVNPYRIGLDKANVAMFRKHRVPFVTNFPLSEREPKSERLLCPQITRCNSKHIKQVAMVVIMPIHILEVHATFTLIPKFIHSIYFIRRPLKDDWHNIISSDPRILMFQQQNANIPRKTVVSTWRALSRRHTSAKGRIIPISRILVMWIIRWYWEHSNHAQRRS